MKLTQFLRAKKLWPIRAELPPTSAAIDEAFTAAAADFAEEAGVKRQATLDSLTNGAVFYEGVRKVTGRLSQPQVDSINEILKAGSHWPIAWMAYGLATAWHESRFLPIMERGLGDRDGDGEDDWFEQYDTGRKAARLGNTPEDDNDGGFYAGRGFVQLTGRRNYGLAGAELGLDLLNYPDLALNREAAAKILVWGMETGAFTGKKLSDYLASIGDHAGYVRARRIINGTDRAELIANYAGGFEKALKAGGWV